MNTNDANMCIEQNVNETKLTDDVKNLKSYYKALHKQYKTNPKLSEKYIEEQLFKLTDDRVSIIYDHRRFIDNYILYYSHYYSKRLKRYIKIEIHYKQYYSLFVHCFCTLISETNIKSFDEICEILGKKYNKWPIELIDGGLLYRGRKCFSPYESLENFYKLPRIIREMIKDVEKIMIFHKQYKSFGKLLKDYQCFDDLKVA